MLNVLLYVILGATTYTAKELHKKGAFLAVPHLLKVEIEVGDNEGTLKLFTTRQTSMGYRDTIIKEISMSREELLRVTSYLEYPNKNDPLLTVFDNGKPIFKSTVSKYLGHVNQIGYAYTLALVPGSLVPVLGNIGGAIVGAKMGMRKDLLEAINRYLKHQYLEVGEKYGIFTSLEIGAAYGLPFEPDDSTTIKGKIIPQVMLSGRVFQSKFFSHGIGLEYLMSKADVQDASGNTVGSCDMTGFLGLITTRFRIFKNDIIEVGLNIDAGAGYANLDYTRNNTTVDSGNKFIMATKAGFEVLYYPIYGSGLAVKGAIYGVSYGSDAAFVKMPMDYGYQGAGLRIGASYVF